MSFGVCLDIRCGGILSFQTAANSELMLLDLHFSEPYQNVLTFLHMMSCIPILPFDPQIAKC